MLERVEHARDRLAEPHLEREELALRAVWRPIAVHHLLHQILLELERRAPTLRVVQQLVPTRLPVRCGLRSSRVALTHDAAQLRLDVLERARVVDHKRQLLGRGRLHRPRRKRREAQERAVDDPVPALGLELLLVRAALQPRHGHAEGRVLRGDHREEAREHVAGHEALHLRHVRDRLDELLQAPTHQAVVGALHVLGLRLRQVPVLEPRRQDGHIRGHQSVVVVVEPRLPLRVALLVGNGKRRHHKGHLGGHGIVPRPELGSGAPRGRDQPSAGVVVVPRVRVEGHEPRLKLQAHAELRLGPRRMDGLGLGGRGDLGLGFRVARRRKDHHLVAAARAQQHDQALPHRGHRGRRAALLGVGVVPVVRDVLLLGGENLRHLDRPHRLRDDGRVDAHGRKTRGPLLLGERFLRVDVRKDLEPDLVLRAAHGRHGVARLVKRPVLATRVGGSVGVGRREARVEARDRVEERPEAWAERIVRRLRRRKVQDLVRHAAVDVLVDQVQQRHVVRVHQLLRHRDHVDASRGVHHFGRPLKHLHVALKALEDPQQLGRADHVLLGDPDSARGRTRKLGRPREEVPRRHHLRGEAADLGGRRVRDVVVRHAHRRHRQPEKRTQRRRAVVLAIEPRVLDGDDGQPLARRRGAAHRHVQVGQVAVALGAQAQQRRGQHDHFCIDAVVCRVVAAGEAHVLVRTEARDLLHQALERAKGDARVREGGPHHGRHLIAHRHLVKDLLGVVGGEGPVAAHRQPVPLHRALRPRGLLEVVQRRRVLTGVVEQVGVHVLVDRAGGRIGAHPSAALALDPVVDAQAQEADLGLVVLEVAVEQVRKRIGPDPVANRQPEVRPLGPEGQHLQLHLGVVVAAAHVLHVGAVAGGHAHERAAQALGQRRHRMHVVRHRVPADAHLRVARAHALEPRQLGRPLAVRVGLGRVGLRLRQRPDGARHHAEARALDRRVRIDGDGADAVRRDQPANNRAHARAEGADGLVRRGPPGVLLLGRLGRLGRRRTLGRADALRLGRARWHHRVVQAQLVQKEAGQRAVRPHGKGVCMPIPNCGSLGANAQVPICAHVRAQVCKSAGVGGPPTCRGFALVRACALF